MLSKVRQLLRNQDAVIAVEFALIMPLLLLLSFGTIEIVRYTDFNQKMDAGTSQLVNLINQNLNLSLNDLDIIMDATSEIIKPFDGALTITITAIQQNDPIPGSPADVMWQVGRDGAKQPSRIAPDGEGSKVYIPGLKLVERDQVITVELFNQYIPLLEYFVPGKSISDITYKVFIGRPRYGAFQFKPS